MQRLSGLDASFLYLETRAQLMHVCGLMILDPGTIPGGYDFHAMKRDLGSRIRALPAFRRKLHDSLFNLGHPAWIEAENMDLDQHVHRIGVPSPGGDKELAELCAHIAGQSLDRSLPLWEMWVIEGLSGGRIAALVKMHHATVDGVNGANLMAQLCTLSPDAPALPEDQTRQTAGGGGLASMALGGLNTVVRTPFDVMRILPGTVGLIPGWVTRARRGTAMPAPFTAPRTSFNGTITPHRSVAFADASLDDVKLVKNTYGAKVNDVVMTMVAGGLRRYLDSRHELPDVSLVGIVPVSIHGKAPNQPSGDNQTTAMFARLYTDVADPVERLLITRDTNKLFKEHHEAVDASLLADWAEHGSRTLFGSAIRLYSHLHLAEKHPVVHNLVVSNVPGPPVPLYYLGARIQSLYPIGPVFHGAGLNVTVMSLESKISIGIVACRELAPGLWPMAEYMRDSLTDLVRAAKKHNRSARGRRKAG